MIKSIIPDGTYEVDGKTVTVDSATVEINLLTDELKQHTIYFDKFYLQQYLVGDIFVEDVHKAVRESITTILGNDISKDHLQSIVIDDIGENDYGDKAITRTSYFIFKGFKIKTIITFIYPRNSNLR